MATPPRRTARGRSNDLLVIYFSLAGTAPLEDAQYEPILARLAQDYYKTPGTVTAALKKLAENLNQLLLNRNLRSSNSGQQSIALLTAAVLRSERLTLGQCGPTHAFIIQANRAEHLHDTQLAGRGLGVTRSVSIRFSQCDLQPNDLVLLTPQPPTGWTAAGLQNLHGQGMETMRRRLLSQAGQNIDAIVAQAQPGTGKLKMLRLKRPMQMVQPTAGEKGPALPDEAEPALESSPVQKKEAPEPVEREADKAEVSAEERVIVLPAPKNGTENLVQTVPPEDLPTASGVGLETAEESELPVKQVDEKLEPEVPAGEAPAAEPEPIFTQAASSKDPGDHASINNLDIEDDFLFEAPELEPSGEQSAQTPLPIREISTRSREEKAEKKKTAGGVSRMTAGIGQASRAAQRKFSGTVHGILRGIALLLKRILPDESIFTIPASTMAFTAVAIAVVMAVAGAQVYFQHGYGIQFEAHYEQAFAAAEAASLETDPLEIRTAWDTTLFFLNKAEEYRTTEESINLRMRAQGELDRLDTVYRLNFQNAFVSGLGGPLNITRLAATSNELFMLNAANGSVLRGTLTGKGYELDPDFKCSVYHAFGPIISIIPGIKNDKIRASVILMDANGNLMYCNPGEAAKMITPALPHTNWGSPVSFTIDSGALYVLDPGSNGVWFYRGLDITNPPHLFFDQQIPKMSDVIDMAVNRDDLYLLHSDGSLTTCKYNALQVSPTRCDDPTTYSDSRPGRHSGPRILDAQFQQILLTQPPDPSLYMLDPLNQSVYHFSLRLNFQRQFRPLNSLSADTATAFTIGPNRTLFLATGNQVYYSLLP